VHASAAFHRITRSNSACLISRAGSDGRRSTLLISTSEEYSRAVSDTTTAALQDGRHSKGKFPAELNNARREGAGNLSKTSATGVIYGGIVPICLVEGVIRIPLKLYA